MKLEFNDIYIRLLSSSDINERYISWFSDVDVTRFLEARNLTIEDSKSYLQKGHDTGNYYIYAICLSKNDLHIGNIKIGPINRKEGISDLVTVLGDKNYWYKGIASISISKAIEIGFKKAKIRKFIASINSLNIGSINAYIKGGFKKEAVITNYFYNKMDKNIIVSDKIFVSCSNDKYDMYTIKTWKPNILAKDLNGQ